MDITNNAITVVIKAPNQRVADHSVECMLGWTVKKLKQHLTSVYPSRPQEEHQKLIYSGKLLQDHLQLKDVLREQETQHEHTVHLVCSQDLQTEHGSMSNMSSTATNSSMSDTHVSNYGLSNQEGVRHRTSTTDSYSQNPHLSNPTNIQTSTGQLPNPATFMNTQTTTGQYPTPMMLPPGADYYTQEQYMMMMQQYYYQMATQYMHYQNTGVYPSPPVTPTIPQEQTQVQPPVQNQEQAQVNPARRDNNNMVMNAQGGMVADDDDEEFGQRDWLDYLHTFARVMVLVSIVYFYSNFTRFLFVLAFFVVVYLYQAGWFTLARRQPRNENAQQEQQADPAQENIAPENPQQQEQQPQANEQSPNEEITEDATPTVEAPPPEPPKPGFISMVWCFVSTFFTSLIPQPPPAVNAN